MHEASSPAGSSQDQRTSADVDIPDSKQPEEAQPEEAQPEEARAEASREYRCNRANSLDVMVLKFAQGAAGMF